jgi:ADP-ribose pyrophosphatase
VKPETLSTETIYKGKVIDLVEDEIRQDEITYKREIVVHKGSAVIIPIFADDTVALVRQYRHAAKKFLLEIPAGTLIKGEDPRIGAIRELEEEIGVVADRIEKLSEFYVSPGFLTEKMHLYMASGLTETSQRLEEDEILSVERYSFDKAADLIRSGEIQDAKTIIGIMLASSCLGFRLQI